jgi:hypothetical protein
MSEANGTDAKDIALHFCAKTNLQPTGTLIARIIINAKSLLKDGHSKKGIIDCINYCTDVKKLDLYSFGFIMKCIDNMYHEMKSHEELERYREEVKQVSKPLSEVKSVDGNSAERNRNKLHRFGAQSRFGEKLDFDLPTE